MKGARSPKAFSFPLRRAFPLVVGGSIPLSELGGHSFAMGWVWFEHRLKHDLKGPSYAMRSIPNLESSRDDKKRALSCVALKKKKDLREERLVFS